MLSKPAASDVPVWSWLATTPDGVEHAYQRQRCGDGRITWEPACGNIKPLRPDQVRQTGARRVCIACVQRLTRTPG